MTARMRYDLACDAPDCPVWFASSLRTATEARVAAKEHGWSHAFHPRPGGGPAKSIDLCPHHKDYKP